MASAAPAFDTLRFQQKLAQYFEPRVATGVAETFGEATAGFATKQDLQVLKAELQAEVRGATTDIIKWTIGSQIVLLSILFAAIKLL